MSRSEERMGLKSGWFLTVIPYSVSMPMTFGMAMRFLAPWRTETPGPGQGKEEGGAPPPSRSRLQILSGIDDALDAPLLLLGLAHQRLHVDDPLTLLPRDLRPVVGVRGVRQVLVLLELHEPRRLGEDRGEEGDRKSTRLNSSHRTISSAVFCL